MTRSIRLLLLALAVLLLPLPALAAGQLVVGTDGRAYERAIREITVDGKPGFVLDDKLTYVPSPIWQLRRTTNGNAIVTVLDDGSVQPGPGISEAQAKAVLKAVGMDPAALGRALRGEVEANGKKR